MISLKLTDLSVSKEQDRNIQSSYLYKDIALDLRQGVYRTNNINRDTPLNDVQAIYDIDSIKTSIANCFLTSPGQRILYPRYGIDLRRYLFSSISNDTAFFISRDIERLPVFEPRITVLNINVEPDEENSQYNIFIQINVPSLDIYGLTLKNYLNSEGYF